MCGSVAPPKPNSHAEDGPTQSSDASSSHDSAPEPAARPETRAPAGGATTTDGARQETQVGKAALPESVAPVDGGLHGGGEDQVDAAADEASDDLETTIWALRDELRERDAALRAKEEEAWTLRERVGAASEDAAAAGRYNLRLKAMLSAKEEEVEKLKAHVEAMSKDAALGYLLEQLETVKGSFARKSEEAAALAARVEGLERDIQDREDAFNRKLAEERGPRLDENRYLRTALHAQKREVQQANERTRVAAAEARKSQSAVDAMKLLAEPHRAEIAELRAWKQGALDKMEEQRKRSDDLQRHCKEWQQCIAEKEEEVQEREGVISRLREWKQHTSNAMEGQRHGLELLKKEIAGLRHQCEESDEQIVTMATEAQEREEIFHRKLVEEQESRQDENSRLRTELCAKEKKVKQLEDSAMVAVTEARKHQDLAESMRLMARPTLAQISELEKWKQWALGAMKEQSKRSEQMTREMADLMIQHQEMRAETSSLRDECEEQRRHAMGREAELEQGRSELRAWRQRTAGAMEEQSERMERTKRKIADLNGQYEEKRVVVAKREAEIACLRGECEEHRRRIQVQEAAAARVHAALRSTLARLAGRLDADEYEAARRLEGELAATSGEGDAPATATRSEADAMHMAKQIHELTLWKKEAQKKAEQERLASGVLAQRVDDLENSVERYRSKYQQSKKALAGMEKALLTVETQRRMLVQTNPFLDGLVSDK